MTATESESTQLPRLEVLGPVEIVTRSGVLRPRGLEADLLALLAANAGRVVSQDRLVDALWQSDPPASARNRIQALVSSLRRSLHPDTDLVLTRPHGYTLGTCGSLDVTDFCARVAFARAAAGRDELAPAADHYHAALAVWRGSPYEGIRADAVSAEAVRLAELRLVVLEEALDIRLRLGQHAELLAELTGQVAAEPLRERLRGHLMLALHRCGRQARALEIYQQGAKLLRDEHGLDPGEELRRLRSAILLDDPALRLNDRATAAEPAEPAEWPVPAQLPADVAAFTGRDDQLRAIDALGHPSSAGTAVVISAIAGLGGVGKTALAIHWSHRMREHFPDGQLYVNLRGFAAGPPLRPLDALAGFLHALGVAPADVPVIDEEAAALYRTWLADRRVLVVLDNARDADQVRPLLPGAAGSVVLITSRNDLVGLAVREGAHRIHVDVLPATESVALLTRLIGADRAAAEPGAVAELAQLCGGLPLALRIAAATLSSRPDQLVRRYAERLREDRLGVLSVDDETGLRSAFRLSYRALSDPDARMFRLLGLVPGPTVAADAAAALAGEPVDRAVQSLERLARAHLVDRLGSDPDSEYDRYSLHDLLRLFAAELASADIRACGAARSALESYYLDGVHGAAMVAYPAMLRPSADPQPDPTRTFASPAEALHWLDGELANLLALVAHTADHGPRSVAWRLTDGLRGYFNIRMRVPEWLAAGEHALAAARTERDRRGELAAVMALSQAYGRLSRHAEAMNHLEHALELARAEGLTAAEAVLLNNRAALHFSMGEMVEAEREFRRALKSPPGGPFARERILLNLGAITLWLGDLHECRRLIAELMPAVRDDPTMYGGAQANLASVLVPLGHIAATRKLIDHALTRQRDVGYRVGEMHLWRVLGQLHIETGDLDAAAGPLTQSVGIARETGNHWGELLGVVWLARLLDQTGDARGAARMLEDALTLARKVGSRAGEMEVLGALAPVRLHLGELDAAAARADDLLVLARARHYRVHEGLALITLGEVALARGAPARAGDHARAAAEILGTCGYRARTADALTLLGEALAADGRTAESQWHWREALSIYLDVESPRAEEVRARLG